MAATDVSRTTLGRILNELDERGWAERTADGDYVATPMGQLVAAEFTPLVESMRTVRELGEAAAVLPIDELSIGLRQFSDGTVRRPEPNDPMAPAAFLTDLLRGTSELHCLVRLAPPLAFERRMRDAVADGRLHTEHVVTEGELAYLRDHPERLRRWRAYLEAGANVYRYDGTIPCNLFVFDETVVIGKTHPDGGGCVFIETEREAVRSWAHELIETYRTEAEPVDAEVFTEEPSMPWAEASDEYRGCIHQTVPVSTYALQCSVLPARGLAG